MEVYLNGAQAASLPAEVSSSAGRVSKQITKTWTYFLHVGRLYRLAVYNSVMENLNQRRIIAAGYLYTKWISAARHATRDGQVTITTGDDAGIVFEFFSNPRRVENV